MLRRRQAGATPAQPLAVARDATDSRGEEPALRLELEALRARQEHLEAARADYEDLFDFAPATYALLNAAGIIVKISLAACRLLDVERRRLVGHALLSFVVKQDRRELLEHLRRCRSQLTAVESELRFSRPDGTLVTCRLYSKGGFYVGRAVFPTIIIDQTDRLALDDARLSAERSKAAAERAQAASSAKDQFLATISHELRTPLTPALIAATGLAASSALPETSRQMAATIKRNIELEAHLIDDLLDVARISRDRVDLNLETIDLHEVLGEALATCAPAAAAKPVIIEASLDATEHHVRGDSLRLHQVFWNLLNNAVKFTEGGGTIVVRSENVWDTVVRISIRDNGAGMDSSLIDTLFSPFERRPAQRGGSRSGLGLGLAI